MIADQVIYISGREVNVHDLETIYVNGDGVIVDFAAAEQGAEPDVMEEERNAKARVVAQEPISRKCLPDAREAIPRDYA